MTRRALAIVLVMLMLAASVVAGCSAKDDGAAVDGGATVGEGGAATDGAAADATGTSGPTGDGAARIKPESIPDGRAIASDGNPEYTFRSLWKKALVEALEWNEAAVLVSASGSFVNDEGVPSDWMMVFATREGEADYRIRIDPWGNISSAIESPKDESFGAYTIPTDIIDSDEAVTAGIAAVRKELGAGDVRDPRLGLGFKPDGAGPYWYYTVLDPGSGDYRTAVIEALTGKAVSVE